LDTPRPVVAGRRGAERGEAHPQCVAQEQHAQIRGVHVQVLAQAHQPVDPDVVVVLVLQRGASWVGARGEGATGSRKEMG
jgi:hypothetical protein